MLISHSSAMTLLLTGHFLVSGPYFWNQNTNQSCDIMIQYHISDLLFNYKSLINMILDPNIITQDCIFGSKNIDHALENDRSTVKPLQKNVISTPTVMQLERH